MPNPRGNPSGNQTARRGKPTIRHVVLTLKTAQIIKGLLLSRHQDYTQENITALLSDWATQHENDDHPDAAAIITT